jgi:acetate kinase
VFRKLGKEGGLLGMSGVSPDMRDVEKAAAEGNARARLALDAFVESVRGFIGQYLVVLGGSTCSPSPAASARTASPSARRSAATWSGPASRWTRRRTRSAGKEEKISKVESRAEVWVVPTNEELIVARQTEAV